MQVECISIGVAITGKKAAFCLEKPGSLVLVVVEGCQGPFFSVTSDDIDKWAKPVLIWAVSKKVRKDERWREWHPEFFW